MTFPLRGLVAAVCLFILAACGGGGGGGNTPGGGGGGGGGNSPPPAGAPTYVGSTAPADLSSSSVVPPLSGWLMLEVGLSDGANSGIGYQSARDTSAAKPSHSSMQQRLDKTSKHAVDLVSRMTRQEVTIESCGISGTVEMNDDGQRDDGTGTVVFTYRDCVEDRSGAMLNGVLRVSIVTFDMEMFTPTDYTMSFENIRITSGAATIEAGGTKRVVFTGYSLTTTRNTVARYLPENVYVRLQDFVATEDVSGNVTMRGRFYQSQFGYVDVQTSAVLTVDPYGAPFTGRIKLSAAGAPRVELRFREQQLVSIAMDANGDGVAERGLSSRSSQLILPMSDWMPMADAGSDRAVDEGETVNFDASDNLDWEGAPLTFSWSVVTSPVGAGAIAPGTGSTYSLTASFPGIYVVQLSVSNGRKVATDQVNVRVRDIPGPIANAGLDRTTIERSTLTLDATGTTYSGGLDSLQFTWTRTQAPTNSSAPATLTGMQPQVTFDLPGIYEYLLSVTGRGGGSTDRVFISVSRVVSASAGTFIIGAGTQVVGTTYPMSINVPPSYNGPPLSLAISSNQNWLTIDTPNLTVTSSAQVTVRLDLDRLEALPNGSYDAVVRIAPSGYSEWTGNFRLQLALPELRHVTPYVVYSGQDTTVNLLGDQLNDSAGRVVVNGLAAPPSTPWSRSKARVHLPALTAGEYTVSVRNELGLERATARVIVRDPPAHPESEVTLPGIPHMVEYDAERDVFYGVFITNAAYIARRFYRQADGTWQFDPIPVANNPRALTLSIDGERLYVTAEGCAVHEVDPATLQTLNTHARPNCLYLSYGMIGAFADGQVLVMDTDQSTDTWSLPDFTLQNQQVPVIYAATGIVSHDRSRMLWAEIGAGGSRALHVFNVLGGPLGPEPRSSPVVVNDAGTNFTRGNLSISGDGSRFMHREDVYNNQYQYVGSLQGVSSMYLTPAVSRQGYRAVVYNNSTDQLSLFDIGSGGGNFPSLGVIGTFAEEVSSLQLDYYPDDQAVFMLSSVRTGTGSNGLPTYEYRMFVREVTEAP
jgi:hypothetical protein